MSAQIGYYDTLKSLAGKVLTYLSTITLTGTDGKTLTITQDTSLDEAVAMSSKAPKTATIAGDGTAGRTLRRIKFNVASGSIGTTLACDVDNEWNGDESGGEDNLAAGTPGNYYSLLADTYSLIYRNEAITGNGHGTVIAILSAEVLSNNTGVVVFAQVTADALGIRMIARKQDGASTPQVWTTLVAGGNSADVYITYLTSA